MRKEVSSGCVMFVGPVQCRIACCCEDVCCSLWSVEKGGSGREGSQSLGGTDRVNKSFCVPGDCGEMN